MVGGGWHYMIFNLFDNWYVDWGFTQATNYMPSKLTYTLFMEDDDGYGRKNHILQWEIPVEDQLYIESLIQQAEI